MLEFAKTLGIGLLTVILSPLIVLMFVVYLIYTILVYIFHELCSIVLFFSGKNYKNDDAETFELLAAKEEYAKKQEQKTQQPVFTYVVQQPPGVQIVPQTQENEAEEGDNNA